MKMDTEKKKHGDKERKEKMKVKNMMTEGRGKGKKDSELFLRRGEEKTVEAKQQSWETV